MAGHPLWLPLSTSSSDTNWPCHQPLTQRDSINSISDQDLASSTASLWASRCPQSLPATFHDARFQAWPDSAAQRWPQGDRPLCRADQLPGWRLDWRRAGRQDGQKRWQRSGHPVFRLPCRLRHVCQARHGDHRRSAADRETSSEASSPKQQLCSFGNQDSSQWRCCVDQEKKFECSESQPCY